MRKLPLKEKLLLKPDIFNQKDKKSDTEVFGSVSDFFYGYN